MEYRCVIVGDPITEPFALLRRLLYDPFPLSEEAALKRQTLLGVRASEGRQVPAAAALPLVSAPPPVPDSWTLTMSNPSMPSVDVSIRFSVVTDPRHLPQLTTTGVYQSEVAPGGMHRRSSDAGGGGGMAGFALREPHCIVLCFNPFSLRNFLHVRAEWTHFLGLVQPHGTGTGTRPFEARAAPAASTSASRKSLIGGFFGNDADMYRSRSGTKGSPHSLSSPGSPMRSGFSREASSMAARPAEMSGPVVLLASTRSELTRQSIEATPSIDAPTPSDVAEVAQTLQARAYAEVDTFTEDGIDALRLAIARACVGDLSDNPAVGYDVTFAERQETVMRAIHDIHTNPDGDPVYDDEDESREGQQGCPDDAPQSPHSSPPRSVPRDTHSLGNGMGSTTANASVVAQRTASKPATSPCEQRLTGMKKPTWTYRHHRVSGRVFYVDRRTRKSQYERPVDYDGKEPTPQSSPRLSSADQGRHTTVKRESRPPSSTSRSSLVSSSPSSAAREITNTAGAGRQNYGRAGVVCAGDDAVGENSTENTTTPEHSNRTLNTAAAGSDDNSSSQSRLQSRSRRTSPTQSSRASRSRSGASSSASAHSTPVKSVSYSSRESDAEREESDVARLVSVDEIDYGQGAEWSAAEILHHMRSDRKKERVSILEGLRRSIHRLRTERRQLRRQQTENAELATHLSNLRTEVEAKEREALSRLHEEQMGTEAELTRLRWALYGIDNGTHTPGAATLLSGERQGGPLIYTDSALTITPLPSADDVSTYTVRLTELEREVAELVSRLEGRRREVAGARERALAEQEAREETSRQLTALAEECSALQTEEASLRGELRVVESEILVAQDTIDTLCLLGRNRSTTSQPPQEHELSVAAPPPVCDERVTVDDYVEKILRLRENIEHSSEEVHRDLEYVGHLTLPPAEECQRLQLQSKRSADATVESLLSAADQILRSLRGRDSMHKLLVQLDDITDMQERILGSEEKALEQLLSAGSTWSHALHSSDSRGLQEHSGGVSRSTTLSASLEDHLEQLGVIVDRFHGVEAAALRSLKDKCWAVIEEIDRVGDQLVHNRQLDTYATACLMWVMENIDDIISDSMLDHEGTGAQSDDNSVAALLNTAFADVASYGPHHISLSEELQRLLSTRVTR